MRTFSGKSGKRARHTMVLSPSIQNIRRAAGARTAPWSDRGGATNGEDRQQQSSDAAVQIEERRIPGAIKTADIEYVVVIRRDQRYQALPIEPSAGAQIVRAVFRHAQFGELRGGNERNSGEQDSEGASAAGPQPVTVARAIRRSDQQSREHHGGTENRHRGLRKSAPDRQAQRRRQHRQPVAAQVLSQASTLPATPAASRPQPSWNRCVRRAMQSNCRFQTSPRQSRRARRPVRSARNK